MVLELSPQFLESLPTGQESQQIVDGLGFGLALDPNRKEFHSRCW
jgi:hypothetical protein